MSSLLSGFVFERVLNEDPLTHTITLLGKLPLSSGEGLDKAVVRVERTALVADAVAQGLTTSLLATTRTIGSNDIYTWMFGWLSNDPDSPDVKINIIFPATEAHIRKYSKQNTLMVRETPELYAKIVKPYILSFPPARTQWVRDILSSVTEAEKVLYRDDDPSLGFVLLPDMKWDLTTISSLYLVAISLNTGIHSLRDLRRIHLPMLCSMRREAIRVLKERWNLPAGSARMYIHYQPSYYHFHVHIVNANYFGTAGSTVGQAHLLDDIIALLELDSPDRQSILEQMTFTYGLGDQHGLFARMVNEGSTTVDAVV